MFGPPFQSVNRIGPRFGLHRVLGSRSEGHNRAKTGSVDHVDALSGYVDSPSSKRLAFSIMRDGYALRSRVGAAVVSRIGLTHCDWCLPGSGL